MLAICEECAAKYNINESRMKSNRARFSCHKCGHVIVVEKQSSSSLPVKQKEDTDRHDNREILSKEKTQQKSVPGIEDSEKKNKRKRKSLTGKFSIRTYLIMIPAIVFLSLSAAFTFLYLKYIPQIMNEQMDMRVSSISQIFAGTIEKPLIIRNYLQVNKETERISRLPGVAYAAVVNEKGVIIAGLFSDLTRFDSDFADKVKTTGFPKEIIKNNKLPQNVLYKKVEFTIGGQEIMERAEKLTEIGGSVHVGLYLQEFDEAIKKALFSPSAIVLLSGIFLGGLLLFLVIARFIGLPLMKLTRIVNRISLGELDLTIAPHGPREVQELARACERMRYSVKNAIERLRKAR